MTAAAPIPVLDVAPRMPLARCAGEWDMFDPATAGEDPVDVSARHEAAQAACRGCPELVACQAWVLGLPKSKRPEGVVAGHIWQPTTPSGKPAGRGRGRPQKVNR